MKYKKSISFILSVIFSLITIFSAIIPSFALSSSVKYVGGAEDFVFFPDNTDLFQNFKDIMPGDSIEQKIIVSNENKDEEVKIYFWAETTDEIYADFLNHINIIVMQDDKTVLSNTLASETVGPSKPIVLGSFKPKEKTELTVVLNVNSQMDNEYQNDYGEIIWSFGVEEAESNVPKTGDNIIPLIISCICILTAPIIIAILKKKERKDK